MKWIISWFIVAALTVIPLLVYLYRLDQRDELGEDRTTAVSTPPLATSPSPAPRRWPS
jgi:hypothetical protein